MSKYEDRARELRAIEVPHYSCAQAVLLPFAEEKRISDELALAIAANFGGGMRMASVCGAVTGALMALGLYGVDDPRDVARFWVMFRNDHEFMDCGELLRTNVGNDTTKKKPYCDGLVLECVRTVEQILQEKGILE